MSGKKKQLIGDIINMELTNDAIQKLVEKTDEKNNTIRVGLTGGGCAGFEYIFDYASGIHDDDKVWDYGKFRIVIDSMSLPFLSDATLDYVKEGINEQFKIINPQETASCGCGISVQFA